MRKQTFTTAMLLLPLMLASVVGARSAAAAPAEQGAAQTFTVMVGQAISTDEGEKPNWQALKFYPDNVTINAGDSILWKFNSDAEPHNVVFLGPEKEIPESPLVQPPAGGQGPPKIIENPLIANRQGGDTYNGTTYTNSGIISSVIPGPKEYRLTFPTAGTFQYLCTIHAGQAPDGSIQGMVGSVTVQAAGSAYPKTTAQVMSDAESMMQADMEKAVALEPEAEALYESAPGPGGTTIHRVSAGFASQRDLLEYQRFIPDGITINQGDTIEWTSQGFHTVTFGEEPELFMFEPQPQGPPTVVYNPQAYTPSGGRDYQGRGYYNSGFMVPGPLPPGAPPILRDKYSLTFNTPGRYEYICITHYELGMDGTVTVEARADEGPPPGGGQPGMPRTGSSTNWLPTIALAGLILALSGMALRLRKSRPSMVE